MLRRSVLTVCVTWFLVTNCYGQQGLGSDGHTVGNIDELVGGAAALIVFYAPVRDAEVEGFKKVLRIVDDSCGEGVHRHDSNRDMAPAIVVICIEDENDVKRHRSIDMQLKNVVIVAPKDHERFLDKWDLDFDGRSIELFTEVQNGKLLLPAERRTSLPLPKTNDPRSSKVLEHWRTVFRNLQSD